MSLGSSSRSFPGAGPAPAFRRPRAISVDAPSRRTVILPVLLHALSALSALRETSARAGPKPPP